MSAKDTAASSAWAAKMDKLRGYKPLEETVRVVVDPDARVKVLQAQQRHADALTPREGESEDGHRARLDLAERRVAAAKAEADESTVAITLRGLDRDVYEALFDEHPPTDEQKAEGADYNIDTFVPALLAACHVERDADGNEVASMPVDDATWMFHKLNQADASMLWQVARAVNTTPRVDLGKG